RSRSGSGGEAARRIPQDLSPRRPLGGGDRALHRGRRGPSQRQRHGLRRAVPEGIPEGAFSPHGGTGSGASPAVAVAFLVSLHQFERSVPSSPTGPVRTVVVVD